MRRNNEREFDGRSCVAVIIITLILITIICCIAVLVRTLSEESMYAANEELKNNGGGKPANVSCNKEDENKNNYGVNNDTYDKSICIAMDGISQFGIPTGCESVSTVTVLRYYGMDITPERFIDDYLLQEPFYRKNGRLYGADPEKAFAGSPYEAGSLGCYEEVIKNSVSAMIEDGYKGAEEIRVRTSRGAALDELINSYVSDNIPVIIWVTIEMKKPKDGFSYYLETGEKYIWKSGEHCVVLCGCDEEYYYLMDPLAEGDIVRYKREIVECRYQEMGERAVIIWEE